MNEDQALLHDALTARLAKSGVQDVWAALGDAGLFGLTVADVDGGIGADLPTAAVVADVLGALCLPTPFIDCMAAARLLAGASSEAAASVRAALVAGQTIAVCGMEKQLADTSMVEQDGEDALVQGRSRLVPDADSANYFLIIGETDDVHSLWLATRGPGVTVTAYPTIDGRMAGDVDALQQHLVRNGPSEVEPFADLLGRLQEQVGLIEIEAGGRVCCHRPRMASLPRCGATLRA